MCLGNGVCASDDGEDTSLLDDGWFLETVAIDSSQEILVEAQLLESVNGFDALGLDDLGLAWLGVHLFHVYNVEIELFISLN